MASLARLWPGHAEGTPTPEMASYYRQRASPGGLIIAEPMPISLQGTLYGGSAGIYSARQANLWRHVTEPVHERGGHILASLSHAGRMCHSSVIGCKPVSASPVRAGTRTLNRELRLVRAERPIELDQNGIDAILEDFRVAGEHAHDAGFDGIEVQAGNGLLLDQFLRSSSNRRTDRYGGSPENRLRLLLEVTQVLSDIWGVQRIGVRLGPLRATNDVDDNDPRSLFAAIVAALEPLQFAYLHMAGAVAPEPPMMDEADLGWLRGHYSGAILVSGGFAVKNARSLVDRGLADGVAFGHAFLANPDLPERLRAGAAIQPRDASAVLVGWPDGYPDL